MNQTISLMWFRSDLRLDDNLALRAAASEGSAVIPVYIWSPEEEEPWPPGAASRWWLHQSSKSLAEDLKEHGSRLILRKGPALKALLALAKETGATRVYWNRRYEPAVIARDKKIKQTLKDRGLRVETSNSSLLFEPWTIQSKSKKQPFQVFTAFWKECLNQPGPDEPQSAPREMAAPSHWPKSVHLDEFELEPRIDWAGGLREAWTPGEKGAKTRFKGFIRSRLESYESGRDVPAETGTSRLSPHLHFGEIGPRTIWHALRKKEASDVYLREIGWREFAHHLLFHFPQTPNHPLRPEFADFPWRRSAAMIKAWQRGRTGYPIVDAGMRELWATGWMHNRVRMIVASFLTKHLRINWEDGAYWFWDTLVDADLANNTLGWQWTAGCGADAAPYFRIFNPVRQSERFDASGDYVRKWVPELAALDAPHIYAPWNASEDVLVKAGIKLGETYPRPIVDHEAARKEALEAFERIRKK